VCFDHDSRPPIPPIAGAAVDGHHVELVSEDGTPFLAYEARASQPSGAAMLILPDVRGLHRYYEELTLRFAEAGIDGLAIDYFGRTTTSTDRGPEFDYREHITQTRYPTLLHDMSAGVHQLRFGADGERPRAVFSVGFCRGGRLAFLTATRLDLGLAGAIGFYGWPVGQSGDLPAPADVASEMRCPVLGLFGGADEGIKPEMVEAFDMALDAAGVDHEVVSFSNAPHSFFDRKAEQFAAESADAWQHVLDFVQRYTPPPA
jgi:carboxymethylenebutenolidase